LAHLRTAGLVDMEVVDTLVAAAAEGTAEAVVTAADRQWYTPIPVIRIERLIPERVAKARKPDCDAGKEQCFVK
jgi:hypothetical protein